MTKRLKSKHKVDRRLKANIWGRPKSPFNSRAYPPGQHGQNKRGKPSITVNFFDFSLISIESVFLTT